MFYHTFMLKASSCSGVRNISGVKCSSSRSNRACEHKVKQIPGRTRPARPFPFIAFRNKKDSLYFTTLQPFDIIKVGMNSVHFIV